jgi:phosphoglycerate kinase
MFKQTINHGNVTGQRVLVRVDFNVPMQGVHIRDDTRIRAVLPTISSLQARGAKIVLCSHMGRPNGKVVEELRLGAVVKRLEELLGTSVKYVHQCVGPDVEAAVAALSPSEVLVLENTRFHPGEEANDQKFARALASVADIYVNDAFGAAHRAHASTHGVATYLPSVAGLLLEREIEMLERILSKPQRPLIAIMGGAKVKDKIAALGNLADHVDGLLVGGGMAATFLMAQGYSVGLSEVEEEALEDIKGILVKAEECGVRVSLPKDVVVSTTLGSKALPTIVSAASIPRDCYLMDIGPDTIAAFKYELARSKTIVWNGPMGIFEIPAFSTGTRALAETLANLTGVTTLIGGGSTEEVVQSLGLAEYMTHVSTGGGATLKYLEGRELPGVAILADRSPACDSKGKTAET